MDALITGYRMIAVLQAPLKPDGSSTGGVSPVIHLDVVRFTAGFELNGIPTAVLSVATGRRTDLSWLLSPVHDPITRSMVLKIAPISVYLKVEPTLAYGDTAMLDESDAWPRDEQNRAAWFRAFRGYVTGVAGLDSPNANEFVLYLTHWLTDLNFSSALSRSSHPANVNQLSLYAATIQANGQGNVSGAHGTPETWAKTYVGNPDVVRNDMWANREPYVPDGANYGLRAWLMFLCQQDRMFLDPWKMDLVAGPGSPYGRQNWEAVRALQHFEPYATYSLGVPPVRAGEQQYVDGVPLSLRLDANDVSAGFVAAAIADSLGRESLSTTEGFTLWDKLVGQLAPQYLLAVVPMVEKALLVPYCPGLAWRSDALGCRHIGIEEYANLEFSSSNVRPLRSVVLMAPSGSYTGGIMSGNNPAVYGSASPRFTSPDPANTGGLFLFKAAPSWLVNPVTSHAYGGSRSEGASALRPGAGTPTPGALAPHAVLQSPALQALWVRYARSLYMQEVTKGRQLSLTGRLRFDIAPGTCVRIETRAPDPAGSDFKAGRGQMHLYGMVLGVSITIDAAGPQATTSLRVGFAYTDADIGTNDLTVTEHPIWENAFYGAPLATFARDGNDPFHHRGTRQMPPWSELAPWLHS